MTREGPSPRIVPEPEGPARGSAPRTLSLLGLLALVILAGVALRARHLEHDIDGPDLQRQAHVASSIHFLLRDGPSASPRIFLVDQTYRVFDFPLYQNLVAGLCALLGSGIVLTARLLNILVYVLTCLVLRGLVLRVGGDERLALAVVFFYSISPMTIAHDRAIIPDNLAILLGFVSLVCFLDHEAQEAHPRRSYAGMLIAGVLSTLIKSPVYLPIAITILVHRAARRRARPLLSRGLGVHLAAILATVVLFKLYSDLRNTGSLLGPSWERLWYFSTLEARVDPHAYTVLAQRVFREMVPPLVFPFFLAGCVLYFVRWRSHSEGRTIVLGLSIGSLVATEVFFGLNVIHDRYQLPAVFPVCFLAGHAVERLHRRLGKAWRSRGSCRASWFQRGFVALLVATSGLSSWQSALPMEEPQVLGEIGAFIRQNTPADALVCYVRGTGPPLGPASRGAGESGHAPGTPQISRALDGPLGLWVLTKNLEWNMRLYLARREGFTATLNGLETALRARRGPEAPKPRRPVFVYIPRRILPPAGPVPEPLDPRPVARDRRGLLFRASAGG